MKDGVERQREHFNAIAEKYLSGRSHANHLAYKGVIWAHILGKLREYMPEKRALLGIEAMCGDADASRRIVAAVPEIAMEAFDLSDEMVATVQPGLTGITVSRGDVLEFDANKRYDLAVVIGGLHHIPHAVERGLRNIHAALKPGGIFLNLEPTHNNPLFRKVRERIYEKNDLFDQSSESAFTLDRYNGLLADAGFAVLYQTCPGLLGYIMYYNPDAFPALNVGTPRLARLLARSDLFLGRTVVGARFSFATWTIARRERG